MGLIKIMETLTCFFCCNNRATVITWHALKQE